MRPLCTSYKDCLTDEVVHAVTSLDY